MKRDELKDRFAKVDNRIVMMIRKYPVVFAVLVVSSIVVGFILGRVT